jgi:hypothetical protein
VWRYQAERVLHSFVVVQCLVIDLETIVKNAASFKERTKKQPTLLANILLIIPMLHLLRVLDLVDMFFVLFSSGQTQTQQCGEINCV